MPQPRAYWHGLLTATVVVCATLASGCGTTRTYEARQIGVGGSPTHILTKVFYATDRMPIPLKDPIDFTADRGKTSYGSVAVSIPRSHRMGELERPSIWRFEFNEDPSKHILIAGKTPLSHAELNTQIKARAEQHGSSSAFVFVHGYNVDFNDAAMRTAQLSYDLGFKGAPIFYSWPSRGQITGYLADEDNIAWSQPNLAQFLEDLAASSAASNIYLIAHSMGTRGLVRAFADVVARNPLLTPRFREIILAAPDIDADVFIRDLAPRLAATKTPVTLYASSKDIALLGSKAVHGNLRAGDSSPAIVIAPGVESIDASAVDTSLIGHSYYGDQRSIVSDIFYIVGNGLRAGVRANLSPASTTAGQYWSFGK